MFKLLFKSTFVLLHAKAKQMYTIIAVMQLKKFFFISFTFFKSKTAFYTLFPKSTAASLLWEHKDFEKLMQLGNQSIVYVNVHLVHINLKVLDLRVTTARIAVNNSKKTVY